MLIGGWRLLINVPVGMFFYNMIHLLLGDFLGRCGLDIDLCHFNSSFCCVLVSVCIVRITQS